MKSKNHFIIYEKGVSALMKIKSNCARDFVLFAIYRTNPQGDFWTGRLECNRFNIYRETIGLKPYQQNTFDVAISELRKSDIIVQVSRGVYVFNPEIIFRGTAEMKEQLTERVKEIKKSSNNLLD